MSAVKIIAIGDNVCDKYLSRGKMYPGGQCVNTCAYAAANGVPSAYLGKFGSDEVAAYNQKILHELGIDISHCRHFEGENGFAMVTPENPAQLRYLLSYGQRNHQREISRPHWPGTGGHMPPLWRTHGGHAGAGWPG